MRRCGWGRNSGDTAPNREAALPSATSSKTSRAYTSIIVPGLGQVESLSPLRTAGRRVPSRAGPANSRNTIHLDQATRERLGLKLNESVDFLIQAGTTSDEVLWAWNATNAMPRIAARLSVASVGFGVIGLAVGVMSLFK